MIFTRMLLLKGMLFAVAYSASDDAFVDTNKWKAILQSNVELMNRVKLFPCGDFNLINGIDARCDNGETSKKIHDRMENYKDESTGEIAGPSASGYHNPFAQSQGMGYTEIDKDVKRVSESLQENDEKLFECRQVLISFLILDDNMQYCQGMADIVALFLRVGLRAEETLKCFIGFIDRMRIGSCFLKGNDPWKGAKENTLILEKLLQYNRSFGHESHEVKPKVIRSSIWRGFTSKIDEKDLNRQLEIQRRKQHNYNSVLRDVRGVAGPGNYGFFQSFGMANVVEVDGAVKLLDYMITSELHEEAPAMVIFTVRLAMLELIIDDLQTKHNEMMTLQARFDYLTEIQKVTTKSLNSQPKSPEAHRQDEAAVTKIRLQLKTMENDMESLKVAVMGQKPVKPGQILDDIASWRAGSDPKGFKERLMGFLMVEVAESIKGMSITKAGDIIRRCELNTEGDLRAARQLLALDHQRQLDPKLPNGFMKPGHRHSSHASQASARASAGARSSLS